MDKTEVLEGVKKTEQHLTNLFKARFGFVYIPTWEEIRIVELITKIANNVQTIKTKRDVFIWSSTEGLKKNLPEGQEKVNNASEAIEALNFIDRYNSLAILILKDVHTLLGANNRTADYNFIRKVRDVACSLKNAECSKMLLLLHLL